jgi:hypothetical protein
MWRALLKFRLKGFALALILRTPLKTIPKPLHDCKARGCFNGRVKGNS